MSRDLRELLHAAAPEPAGALDLRAVARRSRRIGATRILAATLVAAATVATAATIDLGSSDTEPIVGDPRPRPAPEPAPTPPEVRTPEPLPPGPRSEVASGRFGDDWDAVRAGVAWRLLVWGDDKTACWQLAEEGAERYENRSCSTHRRPGGARDTALGGMMSFLTGSDDSDEYVFAVGETGPDVDRLVFRGDLGPQRAIPLHAPPPKAGVPYRYYAAVLPRFDYGRLVALGEDGRVLASRRLCGGGCVEDREQAEQDAVVAYESAPVTLESAAGAFANAALAQAGLVDQFGLFWTYDRIDPADDGFVARFRTMRCFGAPRRGFRCSPVREPGWVRVGVAGGRFVVEDAEGAMSDGQRAALESYSEEVRDDLRVWRLVSYGFDPGPGDEWDLVVAMLWTGNVDAPPDYGSMCRLRVFTEDGELEYESRPLPFRVRDDEPYRVAAMLTSVTSDRPPRALEAVCDTPHGGLMQ